MRFIYLICLCLLQIFCTLRADETKECTVKDSKGKEQKKTCTITGKCTDKDCEYSQNENCKSDLKTFLARYNLSDATKCKQATSASMGLTTSNKCVVKCTGPIPVSHPIKRPSGTTSTFKCTGEHSDLSCKATSKCWKNHKTNACSNPPSSQMSYADGCSIICNKTSNNNSCTNCANCVTQCRRTQGIGSPCTQSCPSCSNSCIVKLVCDNNGYSCQVKS